MFKLKLLLSAIFLLAIVVLGMVINADNETVVYPTLLGFQFPGATLGIWLFMALLVGGMLGFLVSTLSAVKNYGQKALLARKLKQCKQELAQLRTGGLRD